MTGALLLALWTSTAGRTGETPLQSASRAWDRGDYVTALTTYLQVLDSPQGEEALEPIALQTGELYHTAELTANGSSPAFSPDGRFLLYETGAGPARVTRLLPADGRTKPNAELAGYGAVFSPDSSKLAYLSVDAAQGADRRAISAAQATVAALARLIVRDIATGRETEIDTGVLRKTALAYGAGAILFSAAGSDGGPAQIYDVAEGRAPVARTTGDLDKVLQAINSTGTALVFTTRAPGGRGAGGQRGGGPQGGAPATFGLLSVADGRITTITGSAPSFSGDGASLTYVSREGPETRVMIAPAADPSAAAVVRKGVERVDAPALSRDGSRVAFQMMAKEDWEIYTSARDGAGEARVTREIQHDILPVFLDAGSDPGRDRRAAASPIVSVRSAVDEAHAPLPQQHRADDRTRVLVDAVARRHEGADCRGTRRRHRVGRARRLPDGSVEARDARRGARAGEGQPRRRAGAAREGQAPLRADRGRGQTGGRGRVGRARLRIREGAVRLRLEVRDTARQQARGRVPLRHVPIVRLRPRVPAVRVSHSQRPSAARPPTSSRR